MARPTPPTPIKTATNRNKEQDMVTGDLNSARVEWVVQYRIDDPKNTSSATSDPEETLRAASEAIMRQVVGDRTIDEVVTFGRQDIENSCLPLLQQVVKQYELGLRVDLVQLKNINPPQPVQASFDDVNNAQQEKQRDINQATGEYNSIIPRARGRPPSPSPRPTAMPPSASMKRPVTPTILPASSSNIPKRRK